MIDPKLLRSDLETIADQLKIKGYHLDCDAFKDLERERKRLQQVAEKCQQERNTYAKSMGKLIADAKASGDDIGPLKQRGEALKEASIVADEALSLVQDQMQALLEEIPNIPHESVPEGKSEDDNVEIRRWGEVKEFGFRVKDHVDLGADLDEMDFDRAAKITGTRFSQLRGGLASLHRFNLCSTPIVTSMVTKKSMFPSSSIESPCLAQGSYPNLKKTCLNLKMSGASTLFPPLKYQLPISIAMKLLIIFQ